MSQSEELRDLRWQSIPEKLRLIARSDAALAQCLKMYVRSPVWHLSVALQHYRLHVTSCLIKWQQIINPGYFEALWPLICNPRAWGFGLASQPLDDVLVTEWLAWLWEWGFKAMVWRLQSTLRVFERWL